MAIDAHAHEKGYTLRAMRTCKVGNRKNGDVKGQDLKKKCSHAGDAVRGDSHFCIRVSYRRRVGCPFRVLIRKIGTEYAGWQVTVVCANHNRGAFDQPFRLTRTEGKLKPRDEAVNEDLG